MSSNQSDSWTSDGTNAYSWNARNQLGSMNFSNVTFQYDGYGRRTGKTISGSTTNYLSDGANVVQELSGATVTANLLTGLGVDERFTRTDSSGTANFLTDALGSAVALTNSSTTTLASYAYEPFGNTTVTSGSSANRYEYTGRENDGTGVYFYRARYYSPTLQRFIAEDPMGISVGINLYAYANSNPVSLVDPLGLQAGDQNNGWTSLNLSGFGTSVTITRDDYGNWYISGGEALNPLPGGSLTRGYLNNNNFANEQDLVSFLSVFLASDESSYITGIDLPVDGGIVAV